MLIESPEELIVEVGVIGFDLVFKHIFASFEEFFLRTGLVFDLEVNKFSELFRLFQADNSMLSTDCLFNEIEGELHGSFNEVTMILRMFLLMLLFHTLL